MGNDGGTINRSKNLAVAAVRGANVAADDNVQEYNWQSQWTSCRLSGKPLQLPVVGDCKGNIINKEALLEWLLDRQERGAGKPRPEFRHLRRRADTVELHNLVAEGDAGILRCPVGDATLGQSKGRFVYLASCGDVMPQKLQQQVSQCAVCGKAYDPLDVVLINPRAADEHAALRDRMRVLVERGLSHSGKPLPKKKRSRSPSAPEGPPPAKKAATRVGTD
ncbi:FADL356C-Ap [Eremothecium gossypii FDAG1]|nr:FADL356C-Ap [Eremothecium gossypii FDAG1]